MLLYFVIFNFLFFEEITNQKVDFYIDIAISTLEIFIFISNLKNMLSANDWKVNLSPLLWLPRSWPEVASTPEMDKVTDPSTAPCWFFQLAWRKNLFLIQTEGNIHWLNVHSLPILLISCSGRRWNISLWAWIPTSLSHQLGKYSLSSRRS